MPVNQYFNTINFTQEQNLLENLVIESIQIHGQDFIYVPRSIVKEDTIFNEDVLSEFTETHTVEMQIESADGFEGEGDMLSKFGLEVRDQIVTSVSVSRFASITGKPKPLVGDLIYHPISDAVFSIKFVEDEEPFYQLGKNYVYRITSELFVYSHENISTGVVALDDNFTISSAVAADDSIDNIADSDTGLVPLSTTPVDGVIDFTTVNPFSEDY
jgi:hypothetical protein